MRILIVDDEIHVARLLAESVEMQGHEAILALSGEEGLRAVRAHSPDAVFLDISLPDRSGIQVLREIRKDRPTLTVIVITGQASEVEEAEARRLGVTDVIHKPHILRGLDELVERLARRGDQAGK
jgi:DNA-binding response OmpR family regulator